MDSSYLVVCLLNAFLSYTATMLNTVEIHSIRKTPTLSKNLKTLLLSLAVCDLGRWITNSGNGNSRLKNTNKREKMGQFRIIKIHTWLGGCRE